MEFLTAGILGIVEGLTEFIPVSSTGHLIIAGHFLKFEGPVAATFDIFIQLGAILAVAVLYRERFLGLLSFQKEENSFKGLNGLKLLFLTTLPALFFGAITHKYIKAHLFNITTVAIGLGAGGAAILLAEKFLPAHQREGLDSVRPKDALLIGFFQCLALWPGVSRSAATILGAMWLGMERKTSAEYSFFAAVPVLIAATALDLYKSLAFLQASDIGLFAVGFIISFIAAWFSIKVFIKMVSRRSLAPFGWYRIAVSFPLLFLSKP